MKNGILFLIIKVHVIEIFPLTNLHTLHIPLMITKFFVLILCDHNLYGNLCVDKKNFSCLTIIIKML